MIGNFFQLSDYLVSMRDILHTTTGGNQYWNRSQLVAYLNDGLRRRDLDTGQNRVQFPFTLTVNQDTYTLYDVAAQNPEPPSGPTDITQGATSQLITLSPAQTVGYLVAAEASWETDVTISGLIAGSFTATFSAGAPAGAKLYWQIYGGAVRRNASRIFDIVAMNLMYNNVRVVMGQFSMTELNATVRQYSPPLTWAPVRWARYGPNGVVVAPAPSIAYSTEWDCSTIGAALVNDQDIDFLPYPYTEAPPYWAAYRAKLNERQYDEADAFLKLYESKVAGAVNQRVGMVPSIYVTRV